MILSYTYEEEYVIALVLVDCIHAMEVLVQSGPMHTGFRRIAKVHASCAKTPNELKPRQCKKR